MKALGRQGVVPCQLEAVYASGMVLRVRDGPQVFVSSRDKGLLPLQLILRRRDLAWLRSVSRPGLWISVDAPTGRCLLGPRATPAPPCMPTWRLGVGMLERLLEGRRGGMGMGWQELDGSNWRGGALFTRNPDEALCAPLRWLLGRGEGSTPAGDDMLLGALLAHWALGDPAPALRRALLANRGEWPRLTTELSIAYLQAATEGDFAGHLLSLAEAIRTGVTLEQLAKRVNRVLAHGASSGLDCLLGFLLVAREA